MNVKKIYEHNISDHCYIHLVMYKDENSVDLDIIWEGYIDDLPEKYFSCEVVNTGQSMKDLEQGINGYYVYINVI